MLYLFYIPSNPNDVSSPLCCLLVLASALPFTLLSAVEAFEEVSDSLCVPQYNTDGDERVILFLKMAPGKLFCPELVARIRGAIRKALSARHIPALLLETKDIPVRKENIAGIRIRFRLSVSKGQKRRD